MAAQRETAVQPAPMEVPAVAVTHIGLRAQSRVAFVVARRELRIYGRDRARVLSSFTTPLVMMIIFGEGLGNAVGSLAPGVNYREFIFPGILAMSVIMTAMFAGTSVVMDREFGFLREMLVSPASRTAICLGKIVGGGTIATLQSLALFLLAPIIGVDISLSSGLALLGALFLMAMVLASGGVALGTRMKSVESMQMVAQLIIFPSMFLSGVFFPVNNVLCGWRCSSRSTPSPTPWRWSARPACGASSPPIRSPPRQLVRPSTSSCSGTP